MTMQHAVAPVLPNQLAEARFIAERRAQYLARANQRFLVALQTANDSVGPGPRAMSNALYGLLDADTFAHSLIRQGIQIDTHQGYAAPQVVLPRTLPSLQAALRALPGWPQIVAKAHHQAKQCDGVPILIHCFSGQHHCLNELDILVVAMTAHWDERWSHATPMLGADSARFDPRHCALVEVLSYRRDLPMFFWIEPFQA